MTVIKDGYHGDTSRMFMVGKTSTLSNRLCDITRKSMIEGIKVIIPGATTVQPSLIVLVFLIKYYRLLL